MGKFNLALPIGLAYRHNFQNDIRNKTTLHQLKRQSKIDAQVEAKLFAGEMDTISVRNPWDAAGLNKHVDTQMGKIADFLSEHGDDYKTDGRLLVEFKNLTRPLRDNEYSRRDLSFQENKKQLMSYISKHGDKDPHAMKMVQQMENYRQVGRIDGKSGEELGAQEFLFSAPFEGFDPDEMINEAFKELVPGHENVNEDRYGGLYSSISEPEAKGVLRHMTEDSDQKGFWSDHWDGIPEEKRTADNLVDHLYNLKKGILPTRYLGRKYTGNDGRSRVDRSTASQPLLFQSDVFTKIEAKQKLGLPPEVIGDKIASFNMLKNPDGKTITIRPGAAMKIERILPNGTRQTEFIDFPVSADLEFVTEGAWRVMTRPKAGIMLPTMFAEVWVDVGEDTAQELAKPMQEAARKLFKDDPKTGFKSGDIFDLQGLNNIFRTIDEMNDAVIRAPFGNVVRLKPDPDNLDKVKAIQFKIWAPVDISKANMLHYDNTVLNKEKVGKIAADIPKLEPNVPYDIGGVQMIFTDYTPSGSPNWKVIQ